MLCGCSLLLVVFASGIEQPDGLLSRLGLESHSARLEEVQRCFSSRLDQTRRALVCESKNECEERCLKALDGRQMRMSMLSKCFGILNSPLTLDFSFPVVWGNDNITVSIFSNEAYVVVGDGRQVEPYCQAIQIGDGGEELKTLLQEYEYVCPVGFDEHCLCVGVSSEGMRFPEDVKPFRFQLAWLDDRSLERRDSYWGDASSLRTYGIMARIVRQCLGELNRRRARNCPRWL